MALPQVFQLPPGTREPRGHALLLQARYKMPLKLGLRAGTPALIPTFKSQFERQETEKYIQPQHIHFKGVDVEKGQELGLII